LELIALQSDVPNPLEGKDYVMPVQFRRLAVAVSAAALACSSAAPAICGAPICEGDYNDNGYCTDAADYVMWRDNLGLPGHVLPNNPNHGTIGQAEYDLFKQNFGNFASGTAAIQSSSLVASVPEPSAPLLAATAALTGMIFRARRRSGR
jgi:hypothetical protein